MAAAGVGPRALGDALAVVLGVHLWRGLDNVVAPRRSAAQPGAATRSLRSMDWDALRAVCTLFMITLYCLMNL